MNTFTHAALADRIDLIISHVVDGEATPAEWTDFETLASTEPRLWRELAQAQRDAGALRGAMVAASAVADRVTVPADAEPAPAPAHQHLRLNRFGAWTGWAAAAIITIIAAVQYRAHQPATQGPEAASVGSLVSNPIATAADAWNNYLTLGREDGSVLGEMPGRVLVESRPVPQGQGFEVIFIRQIMERRVVPDLYQVTGRDEAGQPTLAPVRPTLQETM